jgi:N-methylhydantoinase A/oxoprolinase/acetone carboxylase beta subunit
VCLLRDGKPAIDGQGARVGPYRTMVEAVAMRTTGLGGDSEVHVAEGLAGSLWLGPRRVVPVSLLARDHHDLVHHALDRALMHDSPAMDGASFVLPIWRGNLPVGLDKREAAIAARLLDGPIRLGAAVLSRIEAPALDRLVKRGMVMVSGVTPSDAAHVLGLAGAWDTQAAEKALTLFARRRNGAGERIAKDAAAIARQIVDQVTQQTVTCILQAAFADDDHDWGGIAAADLAAHPLTLAGLDGHRGIVRTQLSLGVPVVGLGASAASYYGAVGSRLGTRMILTEHADVANAIGAVVGQVAMHVTGSVTSAGPGRFTAHLPDGPRGFQDAIAAVDAVEAALRIVVTGQAAASGVPHPRLTAERAINQVDIEGSAMFIGAEIKVTAQGRPRIATG